MAEPSSSEVTSFLLRLADELQSRFLSEFNGLKAVQNIFLNETTPEEHD